MRRQEREIRDEAEIQEILEKGLVCRLGLYDGQYPYVVPLNYGYRNGCIYFHCAREGRKIDILKKNDRVCIEVDIDSRDRTGRSAVPVDSEVPQRDRVRQGPDRR